MEQGNKKLMDAFEIFRAIMNKYDSSTRWPLPKGVGWINDKPEFYPYYPYGPGEKIIGHYGIDFPGSSTSFFNGIDEDGKYNYGGGVPVYATESGVVDKIAVGHTLETKPYDNSFRPGTNYKNHPFGNNIQIRSEDSDKKKDVFTIYAHLSSVYVLPGETVIAGQIIGTIGNTGNSTGNHLHYEKSDTSGKFGKSTHNVNPWGYVQK